MATSDDSAGAAPESRTTVERVSDCELVVTRTVEGPARLVFRAWTQADLFRRWWVPASFPATLLECTLDVRVGGGYRLTFGMPDVPPMSFFGTYLEVVPETRLVWTNEEAGEAGQVTTVTFLEDAGGRTRIVLRERYPTREALEEGVSSGSTDALPETFDQLEALIGELRA
ncbi:SRPBCC domain-containing protein [Myxococcota bacterium]|nr:SRPBCC domain-containing protein [Myxococcota bacterium]